MVLVCFSIMEFGGRGGGVVKALITKRKKLLRAQNVQNPGCPEIDEKKKKIYKAT